MNKRRRYKAKRRRVAELWFQRVRLPLAAQAIAEELAAHAARVHDRYAKEWAAIGVSRTNESEGLLA